VSSRGKQAVKGFYDQMNGRDVVLFIAKEARRKKMGVGDLETGVAASSQQLKNWRIR
jgi:hypothetical protein